MKIAITGANGHVGSTLCRMLLEQGHEVRAMKYRDDESIRDLDMEILQGDILEGSSLNSLFDGCEAVIHLAAIVSIDDNKENLFRVNVEGTRNVMDACLKKGVRRVIYFSTVHAIEPKPYNLPLDENREIIKSSKIEYELSKARAESLVYEYIEKGLEVIVVNPTAIIGPYDFKPSLTGILFLQLYHRNIPTLVPGGYNWVDVRDVAGAVINALEKGRPGERYLLSGQWLSIRDLSVLTARITSRKTPQSVIPIWVARIGLPFIQAWAKIKKEKPLYTRDSLNVIQTGSKEINNEKARKELGFNPRPLEESVRDIFEWFEKNGYLKI